MNAFSDISPRTPSRTSVYAMARRVREEAQLAMELALDGPNCDTQRALKHLETARAHLGPLGDDE